MSELARYSSVITVRFGLGHRSSRLFVSVAAVCLMVALIAPVQSEAAQNGLRVLFIGNSYIRFNDLPRQVARIAESVPEGPRVRSTRETHGGFDLRSHWRIPRVRRLIESGRYDAVVIQPHSLSPISHPEEAAEYARRFNEDANRAGARLVLFETWARAPRNMVYRRQHLAADPRDMIERLNAFYSGLGRELGAAVAPVGSAWWRANSEMPTMRLHRRDGTHPEMAGTYLSACVLYGTLTGRDPREARWQPWPMSDAEADRIRQVAASSL